MARHDQQGRDKSYTCPGCRDQGCGFCIDVLRFNYTDTPICRCGRADHRNALERAVERERAARRANPAEPSITCPTCHKTSYHPVDIATGYCGFCHDFTGSKAHAVLGT